MIFLESNKIFKCVSSQFFLIFDVCWHWHKVTKVQCDCFTCDQVRALDLCKNKVFVEHKVSKTPFHKPSFSIKLKMIAQLITNTRTSSASFKFLVKCISDLFFIFIFNPRISSVSCIVLLLVRAFPPPFAAYCPLTCLCGQLLETQVQKNTYHAHNFWPLKFQSF